MSDTIARIGNVGSAVVAVLIVGTAAALLAVVGIGPDWLDPFGAALVTIGIAATLIAQWRRVPAATAVIEEHAA